MWERFWPVRRNTPGGRKMPGKHEVRGFIGNAAGSCSQCKQRGVTGEYHEHEDQKKQGYSIAPVCGFCQPLVANCFQYFLTSNRRQGSELRGANLLFGTLFRSGHVMKPTYFISERVPAQDWLFTRLSTRGVISPNPENSRNAPDIFVRNSGYLIVEIW